MSRPFNTAFPVIVRTALPALSAVTEATYVVTEAGSMPYELTKDFDCREGAHKEPCCHNEAKGKLKHI